MVRKEREKVLICPLDWGLGHATRCVPVIRTFADNGYEVVIAAGGRPADFLRREFPDLRFVDYPGIHIRYNHGAGGLIFKMFQQFPKLIAGYFREKRLLKQIAASENPSLIISDNRYGARVRGFHNIIITHQLGLIVPKSISFAGPVIRKILKKALSYFDEVWVPDYQAHNGLAGKLSHPARIPENVNYIGALSRFSHIPVFNEQGPLLFDILVILSGPEPQRTILEEIIISQVKSTGLRGIIIQGLPEKQNSYDLTPGIRVYSHLETSLLADCFRQAEIVICRSGYSGIMDLVTLGKKAILIPTPGQTEQEYLASYLMDKKIFFSISQEKFDLLYAIEMSRNFPGILLRNDLKALKEKVISLSGVTPSSVKQDK